MSNDLRINGIQLNLYEKHSKFGTTLQDTFWKKWNHKFLCNKILKFTIVQTWSIVNQSILLDSNLQSLSNSIKLGTFSHMLYNSIKKTVIQLKGIAWSIIMLTLFWDRPRCIISCTADVDAQSVSVSCFSPIFARDDPDDEVSASTDARNSRDLRP